VSLSSFPTMSKSKRPRNPNEPAITANQKSANSQTPAKPTGTIPQNTPEEAKPPKTLKSAGADAQRSTPGTRQRQSKKREIFPQFCTVP
ncbi:MAG TPA: hypothetical protein VKP01_12035, partial [Saliniramus sp.]|nr:hypothetical protein [Saliniramus sp.]